MNGLHAARPDDDDHANVDAHRQHRRHARHDLHHPHGMIRVGFVGTLKTLAFKICAHKSFDQPRPGSVFLQDGVEPVKFLLHRSEERLHFDHKKNDDDRSDQQKGQHGERQICGWY